MFFVFAVLLISCICADFEVGEGSHEIETSYGSADYIRGWINISLEEESANSVFEDSLDNSISLVELLRLDESLDYNCSTGNCESDYSATNGETTKTFSLSNSEDKLFGFKFDKILSGVSSVKFVIESDAEASCYNQIKLDIFNDGSVEKGNYKVSMFDCSFLRSYGCFDDEESTDDYAIGEFPNKHCQKIELTESPGFKIGADVSRSGDARELTMALYNEYGEEIEDGSCVLPAGEGEIYCEVNYSVLESEDYYVCIYSDESGTATIKGYGTEEGCGFYGTGIQSEIASFSIFAEGKKFDAVGEINITNSLPNENSFGEEVLNYIDNKYGGLDCSVNNCVVPLKITSGISQEIVLKELEIKYSTNLGPTTETKFYDLEETPAIISADFQKIYLDDANFTLPEVYGSLDYKLELNSEEVFSEDIFVESVPTITKVSPTYTASAYPTTFTISVNNSANVAEYKWEFGDNKTSITTTNQVTHTYNTTGTYQMKVTVTDNNDLNSYKTFTITVNSPETLIESMLTNMQTDLSNVKTQIGAFTEFERQEIGKVVDVEDLEDWVKQYQRDFNRAEEETEFNAVLTKLLALKIPESITQSKSTSDMSFYPVADNVNLDILKQVGGGDYDESKENLFVDEVLVWFQENIEAKVSFKEFSARYDSEEEAFLRVFELKTKEMQSLGSDPYLIMKKLTNLSFKENYDEHELSGYIYIDLTQAENDFYFSTTEEVDFSNLPVFISPTVSRLSVTSGGEDTTEESGNYKWVFFVLIIFFLVVVGFVFYIILQEWYKKRYETYLFKDRNFLFNLISYINNMKKKGMEENVIEGKLRKAGWNSEQINYVMKKYLGKRTGMFEIPVDKILKKFGKKTQVEKKLAQVRPQMRRPLPKRIVRRPRRFR